MLDRTTIHISGAGEAFANGEYKMSIARGAGNRPEYRHSDPANTRNSIQWSLFSNQWILDQPGPGLYRIAGRRDAEFPYDGKWTAYQVDVPPNPRTVAEQSLHSPDYEEYATGLLLAATEGHADVVKVLLDHAAQDGVAALQSAGIEAREPFMQRTALLKASEHGHAEVVEVLLAHGAKLEAVDAEQRTPLMIAATNGHLSVVERLVDKAPACVNAKDTHNRTALYKAAEAGHLSVVEYLVEKAKADVDARDADKATALHQAADRGRVDVVKYLMYGGASLDDEDENGWSPLFKAAQAGCAEVVNAVCAFASEKKMSTWLDKRSALRVCVEEGQVRTS